MRLNIAPLYIRLTCTALMGLTFVAVLGASASTRAEVVELDRVIAVVNDDVIVLSELNARFLMVRDRLKQEGVRMPPEKILLRQVAEQIVAERLQIQHAKLAGIAVEDWELDRAIESVAKRNRVSVSTLIRKIRAQGLSEAAYRERLRGEILISKLRDQVVSGRIEVSDAEVESFMREQKSRPNAGTRYNLSHIFIPVAAAGSQAATRTAYKKAEEVLAKLRRGQDFAQIAIAYSKDEHALNGGKVGWQEVGQMPDAFTHALEKMSIGSVSEIIQSPVGFHILRVNDKRAAQKSAKVTQLHVRHIILRPSAQLPPEEARARLAELRRRVLAGEDFARLAQEYSEHKPSALKGGDLGWLAANELPPELARAASALAKNGLSQPISSSYGVHLLQLQGRRQREVSLEMTPARARQLLQSRKANQRYQKWLQQLRDEAYVQFMADTSG